MHTYESGAGRAGLRAFTLIELLIVVAIIAILAAIAVPNFLEAQTRAKVSRVKADHRSMATAIETYIVDNNRQPPTYRPNASITRTMINAALTTPIAYITSVFPDPFNKMIEGGPRGREHENRVFVWWGSVPGKNWPPPFANLPAGHLEAISDAVKARYFRHYPQFYKPGQGYSNSPAWLLLSVGPDQGFAVLVGTRELLDYDPTNGTISGGDVIRFRS